MRFYKNRVFRLTVLVSVWSRPGLNCMYGLFHRILICGMYVRVTTLVSPNTWRCPARHYAVLTLIFGFIVESNRFRIESLASIDYLLHV